MTRVDGGQAAVTRARRPIDHRRAAPAVAAVTALLERILVLSAFPPPPLLLLLTVRVSWTKARSSARSAATFSASSAIRAERASVRLATDSRRPSAVLVLSA